MKYYKILLAFLAGVLGLINYAQAAVLATVPAGLTTLKTDVDGYRDDVWAFIIATVAFSVIIGWALKLRGKRG